ncbi:fibrous sheath-interacting protein 2 isoform X5 [Bubalus bubalis]|uniref:fibrous sheath-interacting protein 2 isoform X5 n=1 Tax=Bubalus bubalis TaxID=89462 RepID=UPI001E1B6A3B|nr:fibrous sheath-interacting protein 2 isoform X5 [Bubalus bubalis]
MDRYLNNCYKAAQAAASKEAASSLTANRELCDSASGGQSGTHKDPIPEVGAAKLLDLPLSVKLPVIPGSNVFYTTNLSEKLYQPSYDFNLSDPYCQLLETGYKNLHHPHLKSYYRGKDIPRRLKKGGYVTSNNKVLCTLNKLNKYRQYLTSLKLDFERNYVREQKMIEKQVNKLYETKRACDSHGSTQFQDLLLQENKQTTPDQELLIKQRYLDMISLELNKLEHMAEKQNVLWIKEEERLHRDHIRRKLSLRRQIEEKWKTNEMLLLSKIGEEVKRESRLEEQRKKVKEDAHRKKKAQLKKKITYHLPKMQRNDLQREGSEENVFENRSQDETEGERETIKDKGPSQHLYSSVKTPERRSTLLHSPHDVKSNTTEQKKDRETIRTSYPSNDGEITTLQSPGVSAKTPSICRYCLQDTSKQQVTRADLNGEKAKKSSLNYEPAPGVSFIHDSPIRQDYHPNRCQEKTSSRNSFQSLIKPDITKVELLKDVQSKKDLIIRLIIRSIIQENLENKEESLDSDEDEVVLQEVVKEEEEFLESPLEDQVKEDMKLTTSTVAHPKPPVSKCSLKKFLSVGKCQPKSRVTIMTEVSPAKQTESEQTLITDSNIDVTTSECLTVTNSPWEKKTQLSETEMRPSTEPTHHFIHRMMSASSYTEEDLASFSSFDDDHSTDPSAKVIEESLECPCLENLSSLEFLTLYQHRSDRTSQYSSNDGTSDFEKPHTSSRQRSEVFSRSNTSVRKPSSPSPPHQERK